VLVEILTNGPPVCHGEMPAGVWAGCRLEVARGRTSLLQGAPSPCGGTRRAA